VEPATVEMSALADRAERTMPEPGGDAFVRFVGVSKTYDGRTLAVANLDLDVHAGEFLTLLGPSGSGKTTTLMMLAGFERPTAGKILIDGADVSREPPYRRGIGMVFQDYALFPHMTVLDNVGFPLKVRRTNATDKSERVRRALDMVQLSGLAERFPRQLSGGQQQRVALARALVFEPRLVLMDEPLGALDKQLREHMQLEIKHIQKRLGVTVVYVTHDQAEALTMSDRIAVFRAGRVEQVDTPSALYEHSGTPFVASFIGENNRLSGRLLRVRGDRATVAVDGLGQVTALCDAAPAPGAEVVVSVRPERLLLSPSEGSVENVFAVRVEETIYLGTHLRVRLAASPMISGLTALVPAGAAEGVPAVGETVCVGWAAGHARVLSAQ
jgi:putative spermidine/putrescine transport system ATP-binding protein